MKTFTSILTIILIIFANVSLGRLFCKRRQLAYGNSTENHPPLPLQFYGKGNKTTNATRPNSNDDEKSVIRQYFRGLGEIPSICDDEHPDYFGGLCYRKCPDGFDGIGPICWENCKGAYLNIGVTCYLSLAEWRLREWCQRDIGKLPSKCRDGFEPSNDEIAVFLCYPKCKENYLGIGPVCYLVDSP